VQQRVARQQVHERVGVARDDVHRRVAQVALLERGVHGRPPAPRHRGVADLRAAEHLHAQGQVALGHLAQAGGERGPPHLLQARPVLHLAAEHARALLAPGTCCWRGQPTARSLRRSLFHSIW
jgi:hypothetical protein